MKRRHISYYYIIFFVILQGCLALFGVGQVSAAGVNDFYFDDFTGDYYLSRDAEGLSHLKVRESVTAVFPNYRQNKGICRKIAFTNQDGENITLTNLTRDNIIVTRNGASEPIYSIDKLDGFYSVCTGTEEYLMGAQTYVFLYEFDRVVTDFGDYQELYWDTNGNGALQEFRKLTARVHFVDTVADDFTGKSWCYVGRYGENGQERCNITTISDGVEFSTTDLKAYENLTFDIELEPGAFVVPAPRKNYVLVHILIGCGAVFVLSMILPICRYGKTRDKRKYYKDYFVRPEYQPHPEYNVAEMAEVYLGKKGEAKVAVLLDMVVRRQVELVKDGESKKGWKIRVKSLGDVSAEGQKMLQILNGGKTVEVDDEIEVKTRTATTELVRLGKSYETGLTSMLKKHGLVEEKYRYGGGTGLSMTITIILIVMMLVVAWIFGAYDDLVGSDVVSKQFVGVNVFLPILLLMIVVTVVMWAVLWTKATRFAIRTEKGLAASRYMDGVKLYIEMAEAERLRFLQGVDSADTTMNGIVRLYEKMLPYAAVLGLEDSWMKELEGYYKLEEITEPDWYLRGITMREMYRATTLAVNASKAATTMSSSGGSSSSGFSGGGGGGFSGGGGGGGGFSGR